MSDSILEKINKAELNYQFLSPSRIRLMTIISGALILASIIGLFARGLNFGIDFTGGTLVEVAYPESVELSLVRSQLQDSGFDDAVVQHFGTSREVLIRMGIHSERTSETLSNDILAALKSGGQEVEMRRVEFVGPQVGGELVEQGGMAMLITLIGILIYVTVRFEYRFSLGAVLALVHDSIIVLGIFALLQMEFDLTVLAAVLAVIGYSLNDTIVIFDRIRDNFLKLRKRTPIEVMNRSINQTLVRSLVTSLTTLMVVLALFFLGGKLIHNFAAALMIGIIVGTYSSIYVASALTLWLGVSKADLQSPVAKETKEGVQSDGSQV
jgi:preprotein translocase subunit SecF